MRLHRAKRGLLIAAVTSVIALVSVGVALACGGLFANGAIDQTAERMIFTVNGDGTITAIMGISYEGEAEDFSWVVPVPSIPEIGVTENSVINTLDEATSVRINSPASSCDELYLYMGRGGGGGGYLEMGSVGPYDYAIIGSEDPDEMITWLRENGYTVTPEMEPMIQVYVEEGNYFAAMKLSADSDVGDIQPVSFTYEDHSPMVALRMIAVGAVPDMPIVLWIFADEQYAAHNYANAQVDFSAFSAPNQVANFGQWENVFYNSYPQYFAARDAIQDQYNGQAFITEYAQPTTTLAQSFEEDAPNQYLDLDPALADLMARFPYVTRLRAQLSPEQMTLDPHFMPVPDAPDVSNIVNLRDHVDPIRYWGCSSRTAISDEARANLPVERMYFDEWQLDAAYPEGWVYSEFNYQGEPAYAFAPNVVTEKQVADALTNGTIAEPMMLFAPFDIDYDGGTSDGVLYDQLRDIRDGSPIIRRFEERYHPFNDEYESHFGEVFTLLATDEDWAANQAMYDAMIDYVMAFQYYARPDMPNTLFLTDVAFGNEVMGTTIPYPDGWIEGGQADGEVTISLESWRTDDAPMLRMTPLVSILKDDGSGSDYGEGDYIYNVWWNEALQNDLSAFLAAEYGLSDSLTVDELAPRGEGCDRTAIPMPFNRDGRQGFITLSSTYVAEISAPEAVFADYEDVLTTMQSSLSIEVLCG